MSRPLPRGRPPMRSPLPSLADPTRAERAPRGLRPTPDCFALPLASDPRTGAELGAEAGFAGDQRGRTSLGAPHLYATGMTAAPGTAAPPSRPSLQPVPIRPRRGRTLTESPARRSAEAPGLFGGAPHGRHVRIRHQGACPRPAAPLRENGCPGFRHGNQPAAGTGLAAPTRPGNRIAGAGGPRSAVDLPRPDTAVRHPGGVRHYRRVLPARGHPPHPTVRGAQPPAVAGFRLTSSGLR